MPYVISTKQELKKLHQTFRHPSGRAPQMLLCRANCSRFEIKAAEFLEKMKEGCIICKKISFTPKRFKLTVGSEHLRCNHRVQNDTMFIDIRSIIHMVDQASHFCAVSFLCSHSKNDIWRAIQRMWALFYLSLPDYLVADQGSVYMSKTRCNHLQFWVCLNQVPNKTPGSIGTGAQYHSHRRHANNKM